jgi:L-cysteine:1D-myo-inositol 2-amino-2-deoxy-alpha-D-glucopyranoside ligase
MYVCGITPYDATHLGHAATYLAFDLVHRVWLDSGHKVHYVQNVTDVDDPLFERAQRDGVDWRELADRQTDLFREDMAALRVLPPHDYVAATEAIGEVVELVEKMLASGAAYVVDDPEYPDVYFHADATQQFGYESGYDRDTMLRLFTERGGDPDRAGKSDELDALMWRAERAGEPSWPSPFGPGRPGWHVECTAIALSRIGTGLDIQGGGSDLIFPHHEFSAAHAESVTGERRFARHYVHAGMIGWDGHKMSKSRGNLVLVSRLRAEGVEPAAIRLGLLAGHYRADRYWSDQVLEDANARLQRWRAATTLPAAPDATDVVARVRQYLADDLDTLKVLAALDGWATDALDYGGHDTAGPDGGDRRRRAARRQTVAMTLALTVFQGRAGDHNARRFGGAAAVGAEWQRRLGLTAATIGAPQPPLSTDWQAELTAATPTLEAMAHRYDTVYTAGQTPVTALTRCAVALATLPVVARFHPDALVVWFDAHGDINTPESSTTGYIGGLALSGPMGWWDSGLGAGVAPANVILGGARDLDSFERRLIDEGVVRHVPVGPNMLDDLDAAVGDRPVYFHLDCDVLEPGLVPTDYRVPNGLSLDELGGVARRLAENTVVGVEVAEFEDSWSDTGAEGDPGALLTALSPLVGD